MRKIIAAIVFLVLVAAGAWSDLAKIKGAVEKALIGTWMIYVVAQTNVSQPTEITIFEEKNSMPGRGIPQPSFIVAFNSDGTGTYESRTDSRRPVVWSLIMYSTNKITLRYSTPRYESERQLYWIDADTFIGFVFSSRTGNLLSIDTWRRVQQHD